MSPGVTVPACDAILPDHHCRRLLVRERVRTQGPDAAWPVARCASFVVHRIRVVCCSQGGPCGGGGLFSVLVFVHGGGFASGQGGGEVHDGQYLANATASVVLTFNYRLGALGSISIPGSTGFGGNLGMQDQVCVVC